MSMTREQVLARAFLRARRVRLYSGPCRWDFKHLDAATNRLRAVAWPEWYEVWST